MLIVTANCKNTFDSYLKYVHYTDSKRRKTRFSGATGWLLLACAAAVIVSFVKVGGNIFLYVVSAVLVLCAAAYVYIQYLAPYRRSKSSTSRSSPSRSSISTKISWNSSNTAKRA